MDDLNKYKDSGILEMYVYGLLSEEESRKVSKKIRANPELLSEVEEIEKALIRLSADYYAFDTRHLLPKVSGRKRKTDKSPLFGWIGTAATILLLVISGFLYFNTRNLKTQVTILENENELLKEQIVNTRSSLAENEVLLEKLRAKNITRLPLNPQQVDPKAFAVAYMEPQGKKMILDAKYLPEPPRGKVYQVWSLKFEPLTPTSMGLLEDFAENEKKVFQIDLIEGTEGVGITLEPEGGSETPTMEQLYVLGALKA